MALADMKTEFRVEDLDGIYREIFDKLAPGLGGEAALAAVVGLAMEYAGEEVYFPKRSLVKRKRMREMMEGKAGFVTREVARKYQLSLPWARALVAKAKNNNAAKIINNQHQNNP